MKKYIGLVFLMGTLVANATDPYPKNDALDVKHYTFQLEVNDSTNSISGQATISIFFTRKLNEFELDLADKNGGDQGMEVVQVLCNQKSLRFLHKNDRLRILLTAPAQPNELLIFQVFYHGIPKD